MPRLAPPGCGGSTNDPNEPATMCRMERAITATITGRVHGVGFRYNTREMAQLLGLTGWVRNRPDGSVELLAQGDSDVLSLFIQFLGSGPPASRVASVEVTETAADPQLSGFRVRF